MNSINCNNTLIHGTALILGTETAKEKKGTIPFNHKRNDKDLTTVSFRFKNSPCFLSTILCDFKLFNSRNFQIMSTVPGVSVKYLYSYNVCFAQSLFIFLKKTI